MVGPSKTNPRRCVARAVSTLRTRRRLTANHARQKRAPRVRGTQGGFDRLCDCRFLDIDHDRDVDAADYALFATAMTGPE